MRVISLLEGSGLPVAGEVSLVLSHASIADRSYVWFGFGIGVGVGLALLLG